MESLQHPLFARAFARVVGAMDRRGAAEHRRRILAGLHGSVIEIGAGAGSSFPLYPSRVAHVLALEPDLAALGDLKVGVIGPHSEGSGVDFEVRTFIPGDAMVEDPVTGSFNAGAAQWLIGSGRAPEEYTAAQGTVLGRAGRIHVSSRDGVIWVGGASATCIQGTVVL